MVITADDGKSYNADLIQRLDEDSEVFDLMCKMETVFDNLIVKKHKKWYTYSWEILPKYKNNLF